MPLTDREIIDWARNGGVQPFFADAINPASIDLHLGYYWYDFQYPDNLRAFYRNRYMYLYPNVLSTQLYNLLHTKASKRPTIILAMTEERISIPDNMAASVKLKTTPTRKGLGQIIGDWVDPGFTGNLTLMLYAHKKIELKWRQPICQLILYQLEHDVDTSYKVVGHYDNKSKPTFAWDEWRKVDE